jgi:hypothetical protein
MDRSSFFRNRQWTRVEVAIWLFALAFVVIAGTLVVTGVIDSWALLVGNLIAMGTTLMLYRAERANGEADEHDE